MKAVVLAGGTKNGGEGESRENREGAEPPMRLF